MPAEFLRYSIQTQARVKRLIKALGSASIKMAPLSRGGIAASWGERKGIKRYLYFRSGQVVDWVITDVSEPEGALFYI